MSVSSASSANSLIRMSGMNSGFDTEALVEAMSAMTKLKIDSNSRKMQITQWKQDTYRDVITQLQDFQSKYLDALNTKTYLMSKSAFSAYSTSSSNAAVTATASSSAAAGTYTLNVTTAATAAKVVSDPVLDGKIQLNADAWSAAEKTVTVTLGSYSRDFTYTDKDDLNSQLYTAFGESNEGGARVFIDADNKLVATGNSTLSVKDSTNTLVNGTVRNKLALSNPISSLSLANPIVGGQYEFTINGVEFSFDASSTVNQVISAINNSSAGVKMSYSSVTNQFTLTSTQTGGGQTLRVEQTTGNLLTSLLGLEGATAIGSISLHSPAIDAAQMLYSDNGTTTFSAADYQGKAFTLNVDGEDVTVRFAADAQISSYADLLSQINKQLSDAGAGNVTLGLTAGKADENNDMYAAVKLSAADGTLVTLSNDEDGLLSKLGFSAGMTNQFDTSAEAGTAFGVTQAGTITIGGHTMNVDATTTVEALAAEFSAYGMSYDEASGTLRIAGQTGFESTGGGSELMQGIFGAASYSNAATATITQGQNATFTVNGEAIESDTNNITYNGVTFSVTQAAAGAGNITVNVTRNTDSVLESIKTFVEDYNTLIASLNSQVSTKPDSDYFALTDDEKADMTEDQVEKWEKMAKQGLLYGDSEVSTVLSRLRSALNGSVNGVSLYSIGITTSSDWSENGKLEIDEAKLKAALQTNPDQIAALFADSESGLAYRVKEVMDYSIKSTGVYEDKGTLVRIAGLATGTSAIENQLTKQLTAFAELAETLQQRYEDEQDRYYARFTAMETALSSLNSQSSYLSSMLGNL